MLTEHVYDDEQRLEYKRYYLDATDYGNGTVSEQVYYVYDNLGREVATAIWEYDSDPVYTQCYEKVYDIEGRVGSVNVWPSYDDYVSKTNLIDSVAYGYNEVTGRKSHVCTPAGDAVEDASVSTWVSYRYDPLGRLADLEVDKRNTVEPDDTGDEPIIDDDEVAYYDYNPVGSRAFLEYPNGNLTEYQYDALNRLDVLTNWQTDAQATVLSSFDYDVAADGMRRRVEEVMGEERTIEYKYDDLNRLVEEDARETDSTNSYGYNAKYVYDLVGNRKSREVTVKYYQDENDPVKEQKITTSYLYYSDGTGDTDRLQSESHSIEQISLVLPDEQIYLYASAGGNIHYTKGCGGERISQWRAMLYGLPTRLASRLFYLAMGLVVVAFFAPVIAAGCGRLRRRRSEGAPAVTLSLYHRCVLMFLAYAFLIGPFGFEQLARGDLAYQDLLSSDWGTNGEVITYTYDENGAVATKVVNDGTPEITYTYEYNLRGRQAKVIKSVAGQTDEHVTEYKYNPQGIRVCAYNYDTPDDGDTRSNEKTVDYLIDSYNHTGYAQTLAEGNGTNKTTYIIGDDVLGQVTDTGNPQYLLYDGHGSTRQLVASDGSTINDSFSYDAYGVMLGGNPQTPAATNLLYAGEDFDTDSQNYYLRARWYNQNNGRFNRVDPFSGNNTDPQSLHKYLYVHCNPINASDPMGLAMIEKGGGYPYNWRTGTMAHAIFYVVASLRGAFWNTPVGRIVRGDLVGVGLALLRPDAVITKGSRKGFYELKPITHRKSPSLAAATARQMKFYDWAFAGSGIKRGKSLSFLGVASVHMGIPAGYLKHDDCWWQVKFYGSIKSTPVAGNGQGLIYYSLTKINYRPPRGGKKYLRRIAVPDWVKENVRIPQLAPITVMETQYIGQQAPPLLAAALMTYIGMGLMMQSLKPGLAKALY